MSILDNCEVYVLYYYATTVIMYIDLADREENKKYDYYAILRNYCELNDIPYHSSRDIVVEYMINHSYWSIMYHTPYQRVFTWLHQLISGWLSLEDFMMCGDISKPALMHQIQDKSYSCLVCDKLMLRHYSSSESLKEIIIQ